MDRLGERWSCARWVAALGAALVLAALVLAATNLQLGTSNVNTIAKEGDAKTGLLALERSGIGSGVLVPPRCSSAALDLARARRRSARRGVRRPRRGRAGAAHVARPRRGVVDEFPTPDASTAAGRDTLERVQAAAHAAGAGVRVGGIGAQNKDFIDAVYGNFPLMIA